MQGRGDQSDGRTFPNQQEELTVAEEQLISLLRQGAGASTAFTVVIRKQRDGRFFVSQSDAARAVVPSFGSGESFPEAWKAAGRFSHPSDRPASSDIFMLAIDGDVLHALDIWIGRQPQPEPTRGEAATRAIRDWLSGLGLLTRRPHPNTH